MNFSLIKDLIDAAEQFSTENDGKGNLPEFAQWLHHRTVARARNIVHPEIGAGETVESVIGKLVVFMNRYAKAYTKKALQHTELSSADEFVFLICLLNRGAMSKMDLIHLARLEKPTGMEILRRLAKAGFIEEKPHDSDKRSKKISLTGAGQQMLFAVLKEMDEVANLVTGNLNEAEKHQLLRLLLKLEDFHEPLQHQLRRSTWAELMTVLKAKSEPVAST